MLFLLCCAAVTLGLENGSSFIEYHRCESTGNSVESNDLFVCFATLTLREPLFSETTTGHGQSHELQGLKRSEEGLEIFPIQILTVYGDVCVHRN